jgi:hypothetical protein
MPLMSHEVRWYFPGELARFKELIDWIEATKPFQEEGVVPPPAPEGRLDGKPDVYLVVPGADDMGVKWREGQLQIKGRMARYGLQRFGHHFYGAVETWAKWSYAGDDVRQTFAGLFGGLSAQTWETVSVKKTRVLRKTRLDTRSHYVEIAAGAYTDRGLTVELTDLDIGGQRYCSLGFEAYPDDTGMAESFTEVVSAWLKDLENTRAVLAEHQSMGYPEFLRRRSQFQLAVAGQ